MKVAHELFKLTTANENTPDSPFEGCEALIRLHGAVSDPDWTDSPPDSGGAAGGRFSREITTLVTPPKIGGEH